MVFLLFFCFLNFSEIRNLKSSRKKNNSLRQGQYGNTFKYKFLGQMVVFTSNRQAIKVIEKTKNHFK